MRKLLSFLIPILCVFSTAAYSQTPEKALENIVQNYDREGIYIHFDKTNYVAGETIWFKAYVAFGIFPSDSSTVINVELVDDSGVVMIKKILPLIGSSAAANFDLPKSAHQMTCTVRAYTRRMLNYGSDAFYEHQLQVFNPSERPGNLKNPVAENIVFLPEGGNIIAGVPNSIGFIASDAFGMPVNSYGSIINSKGDTVVHFNSVHDGMGKFFMYPEPGEHYKARCFLNKEWVSEDLPPILVSGISFQVQASGSKLNFTINKEKLANSRLIPTYLLGVMENNVVFKLPLPPEKSYLRGNVPLGQLPSGILQLTLFNSDDEPVAERMAFVNSRDYLLGGTLSLDTFSTMSRAKNVFSYSLATPMPGTFSIAVTDYNKDVPSEDKDNIISRFLLANDIRGNLYNPSYYFETDDEVHRNNLDLVMLTHGWRRFNWDQILRKQLPALSYKDPQYITLAGKAYKENSTQLLTNTQLSGFITTRDSVSEFMMLAIDAEGNFEAPGMIFKDTAVMKFQVNSSRTKGAFLNIYTLPLSKLFSYIPRSLVGSVRPIYHLPATEVMRQAYVLTTTQTANNGLLLSNVTLSRVKRKSKTAIVQDRYTNGIMRGSANTVLDFISNPVTGDASTNIFEYLKSRVSGLTVTGSGVSYFLNYRGNMSLSGGAKGMSVYLDGFEASTEQVATIPVSQVALVQVFGSGLAGGSAGSLAIYTKKGEDYTDPRSAIKSIKLEGFSPIKEFYSPDYSNADMGVSDDQRTTIYWDPYLVTTTDKPDLRFSFFNTDNSKKFRIILTGMTANGKLLYLERITP